MLLEKQEPKLEKTITHCPYCQSATLIKKGKRKKKMEEAQIYFCSFKSEYCSRIAFKGQRDT